MMSSDLELPRLDLPSLKLPQHTKSDGRSGPGAIIQIADGESQLDHDDGCRTPTSEEHRIPMPTTCPPVRRKMMGRKRRRTSEVEQAKVLKTAAVSVSHVEVDEFFCRIERVRDRERVRVVMKGDGVGKKSVVLLQLR